MQYGVRLFCVWQKPNTQLFFLYQRETHSGRRLPTVAFYRETRWWNTWSDIPTKGVFFFFPGLSGFFFPHYTRVRRHPKPATGNITAKARRRSIGPQKAFMTDKLFPFIFQHSHTQARLVVQKIPKKAELALGRVD